MQERDFLNSNMVITMSNAKGGGGNTGLGSDNGDTTGGDGEGDGGDK